MLHRAQILAFVTARGAKLSLTVVVVDWLQADKFVEGDW